MTNDAPDRVWVYASNIETWRGVGEWTDGAEPDCSDEWPHAPFLHATPARLHAEELVALAQRIVGQSVYSAADGFKRLHETDESRIARALLSRIEQEKP